MDLLSFGYLLLVFPGLSPVAMYATQGVPVSRPERYSNQGYNQGASASPTNMFYGSQSDGCEETTFLYIPNYSVGAIIGTKVRFSAKNV